eukprot:Lithocolla_globosa_v1_NODE_4658_length_1392_cov_23.849663.p1 type:complete len:441 gc:universal NODE_4658_length_1392_cov_23.849663:33-1355(+)
MSGFCLDAIKRGSPRKDWLFCHFHESTEPNASLQKQGLTFRKENSPTHLAKVEDDTHYYNTSSGETFWHGKGLPQPTKDIVRLRADLDRFGYALIQDALSTAQLHEMRRRTVEQAAGERAAGIALWLNASATGSNTQFVTTLLNKGACFEGALEFCPEVVQAGPLMEQLLTEALGGDFLINSFQAIIAHQNGYPQALHQDANGSGPFQTPQAPLLVTAMYMLDDVDANNGGTLVIPTSHRLVSQCTDGGPLPQLPPTINVTAPAGTVMLFDARLLHGTGVNRTPHPRHILISGFLRTFMRTQEAWLLSARPDVLERASPRLRQRLGFCAHTIGTIEGHGLGATGNINDEFSTIYPFRTALDAGMYHRIGELGSKTQAVTQPFTYRETASGRRSLAKAEQFGLLSTEEIRAAKLLSYPEGLPKGAGYNKRGTGNNELGSKL